jgi:MFS transporter, DHA2 family, multidrug resistance protein
VIYGLKQIAQDGLGGVPLGAVVIGTVVGVLFVRRQRRLADPMIDLALFRSPGFSAPLAANLLGFAVVFGIEIFVAQHLQLVLGFSPLEAGLWSVPGAAAFVLGSQATPPLAARVRPATLMLAGLFVAMLGVGMLTQVEASSGAVLLVTGTVVLSLGLAPLFTLAADLAIGSAPPERAGAASGISETSSELGGALGIAVLGTIGAAVYRSGVADGGPDTLGGAVQAAERLPPAVRAELLEPAREAFTHGLQVAATVSGAIIVAAAIVIARGLRRERRDDRARLPAAIAAEPTG